MSKHDKRAVAASFGRAAQTYDSVAHFQRAVGARALQEIPDNAYQTVLDIGSGTGYFFEGLSGFAADAVINLDLSWGMLDYARQQHPAMVHLIQADAEALPFAKASIDLIFSSLAIQWCDDLDVLMANIKRVLKPGGVFVFTTLLDGTLHELKQAWSEVDQYQHVNEFFTLSQHEEAIRRHGMTPLALKPYRDVLYYDKLGELTRELKMLGAHNVNMQRPTHVSGRGRLRKLTQAYERFRQDETGLPASYEVLQAVVRA
ncbi:MAG: malonyl-ACP O-methyltransferase BioC [Oleiphilaceae bacterium]|nr:malonyl-ACP O-methyltransferase BioC [Oleiphilaceae bacterium]